MDAPAPRTASAPDDPSRRSLLSALADLIARGSARDDVLHDARDLLELRLPGVRCCFVLTDKPSLPFDLAARALFFAVADQRPALTLGEPYVCTDARRSPALKASDDGRSFDNVKSFLVAPWAEDDRLLGGLVAMSERPFEDSDALLLAVAAERVFSGLDHRRIKALRQRQERLNFVVATAPALISYLDTDFRYQLVNDGYERWFGKKADDMVGRHAREILGEEAWAIVRPYMEQALSGQVVSYEEELPHLASGGRWVNVSYTPDFDEGGRVRGFSVLVHDVGARRRVEDELRRSMDRTARLQQLSAALADALTEEEVRVVIVEQSVSALDATAACLACLTPDEEYLYLCEARGYDPAFLEGWERFSLDANAPMAEAARSGVPVFVRSRDERLERYPTLPLVVRDQLVTSSACIPMLASGRLLGVIGLTFEQPVIFRDEDEDFLLALGRQCAQAVERSRLYVAEQRARAEAEASNRAKDQFLAVLSHELRTPLTPVLTAAHLLETVTLSDDKRRELARMIRRNAELEARIIDDLLDLTRVARGKLALTLEPVDVHRKIDEVIALCKGELDDKRVVVTKKLLAQSPIVRADRARLQQVLWNLLKNAAKFSQQGGRVTVRTRDEDGELVLAITDEGVGINPELLPKIFDAFEQGDRKVTRQFGGLGLGLAVSKALVDAIGGSIRARSEGSGRGACFEVRMPVIDEEESAEVSGPARMVQAQKRRVLVVEDNEDTLTLLLDLLRDAGYTAKPARSVSEALIVAAGDEFDLLLSDIGLPDGTGLDLMRQLQARQPWVGIALSGFGMERDVLEAKGAGFTSHLTKPVNPRKLLDVMQNVLDDGDMAMA